MPPPMLLLPFGCGAEGARVEGREVLVGGGEPSLGLSGSGWGIWRGEEVPEGEGV